MKNLFLHYLGLRDTSGMVIATVVRAEGSSPQKPGSVAIIDRDGVVAGTVGGGVTEGRVLLFSHEAFISGQSGLFTFNLANNIVDKTEAVCGGEMTILLDANPGASYEVFDEMRLSLQNNLAGVLITEVTLTEESVTSIRRSWIDESEDLSTCNLNWELISEISKLISKKDQYGFGEIAGTHGESADSSVIFLQPFFPRERLIIAGAGHIGKALSHLGNLLDFDVTVIDDRPEYANRENIPDADQFIVDDIGKAMEDLKWEKNTYVVIVTRGHKDDALALKPCIGREIAYKGMIGSKVKTEAMRREFLDKGWATPEQWATIHAPVGLAINSKSVEEIAISIAAELVMVRNGRKED